MELVKNGSHIAVTGSNLADYIRLAAHWLVIEGAGRQMDALLEGFDSVLPNVRTRLAALFQADEMEGLFCGRTCSSPEFSSNTTNNAADSSGCWAVQSLTEACQCDHGYTPQSRCIRYLFEVMSEFTDQERRLFVQFVTGSPRLPIGGRFCVYGTDCFIRVYNGTIETFYYLAALALKQSLMCLFQQVSTSL